MHELPDDYLETVDALHRLTVYVVSPAQRLVNGEIILRSLPGGFGDFAALQTLREKPHAGDGRA